MTGIMDWSISWWKFSANTREGNKNIAKTKRIRSTQTGVVEKKKVDANGKNITESWRCRWQALIWYSIGYMHSWNEAQNSLSTKQKILQQQHLEKCREETNPTQEKIMKTKQENGNYLE